MASKIRKYVEKENSKFEQKFQNLPNLIDHSLILGSTYSGKTYLLKAMLLNIYKNVFHNIKIFSRTIKHENFGELFNLNKEDLIEDLSKENIEKLTEEDSQIFLESKGRYLSLYIFDDIGRLLRQGDFFENFITVCRHSGIKVILLSQYMVQVTPGVRTQFSNIIFSPVMNKENIKITSSLTSFSNKELGDYIDFLKKVNENTGVKNFIMYNKKNPTKLFIVNTNKNLDEINLSEIVED